MAELFRLEHPNDPSQGGVLFVFSETCKKQASWRDLKSSTDTIELSKKIASQVLQALLDGGQVEVAEGVNWVSVVAGVAHHVDRAKARLVS